MKTELAKANNAILGSVQHMRARGDVELLTHWATGVQSMRGDVRCGDAMPRALLCKSSTVVQ